jgi:purine-cytosine permease-like protein
MMLLGTLAAALYPTLEVTTSLRLVADTVLPGLGRPLLLASLLGLIAITSLNYYGASLTLLSVVDCFKRSSPSRFKRIATLLLSMAAATLLAFSASSGFVAKFGDFLAILLYLFTPWTAINLVDFYLVRKGAYSVREIFNARGMYGSWNWRGLTAYGVGFVAMIPFFSTGLYTGPVAAALGGADIAMLVGLPVAAVVYVWACRSLDLEADRLQAQAADVGLD